MLPVLSQATILPHPLAVDLDACVKGGVRAVELWLTKVEEHLKLHSPEIISKMYRDSGITLVAASYQGGLLGVEPQARKSHLDHFKRRLDLCQALAVPVITLLPALVGKAEARNMPEMVEQLAQAADWADAYGLKVALSFRTESPLPNNLQTALALVEAADRHNLGVALDCLPFFIGPSKTEDLGWITPGRLLIVRVCDLAGGVRELTTDADTVLPGEGDLPLTALIDHLRKKDYTGPVSVELFNPRLWQVKPSQVAELAWSSVLRLLGQRETMNPPGSR